ncbi:MAG: AlkA N-terminal domain-containing protein [Pseudomonadota bacterium]|nr:AlkA N-terminal domain-containing protein [Pseudomonadota bacterium]MDQ8016562.1 AlkA N-terminal domain-containing protein [Pseudomonadota bacterium]
MPPPPAPIDATESDACYLAMKTHDARFDGRFFTAVTSTGIYCRPVCRVKTPRRENCRFYRHAAQAEAAGFRPCLRCRPELAPRPDEAAVWSTADASRLLGLQAARLMDDPAGSATGGSVAAVARRLGVSERHLRRIVEAQFGVSPLQYLQTRRLLAAKQLIADTTLPMTEVAMASGFASVRRFNAAFVSHYGLNPSALRRAGPAPGTQGIRVRLGWRPPYDVAAMLGFFARRAIPGVEQVAGDRLARTVRVGHGAQTRAGWLSARFDVAAGELELSVDDALAPVLPAVIARVRALFDLDADPAAIDAALHAAFPLGDGVRVPGAVDGFELAVRAVLGQQVTVAAARTLGARLVQAFGEPLATPIPGLDRLFPTPAALAAASGDALGRLGIVRQRQAALQALAHETLEGRLALHPGADVARTCAALQALPGIGDWTAQYIAMRALRWPDAFPAGDVALQKALEVTGARAAAQASEAWRPWRSYAVLRAWHAAAAASPPPAINSIAACARLAGAAA